MRPLQPRERMMLRGLGLFLVVVLFYTLVYAPRTSTNADLAKRLARAQADVASLQAQAQRKDVLQQQIAEAQNAIQAFEAKLPSTKEAPNLLIQLDALAHQSGVDLRSIKPSPLKPAVTPTNGAAEAPANAPPPTLRGQPVQQSGPSGQPVPLTGYEQFTVSIQVQGTFPTVLAFARGLEAFPRFLAISDIKLTPAPPQKGQPSVASQPLLALDVTTTAYVLPEKGDAR